VRIPDSLSYEEDSTLHCAALTAWSALTLGTVIRSGHTVLTQGTGGVSIFAVQLAKAVGASVIATVGRKLLVRAWLRLGGRDGVKGSGRPDQGAAVFYTGGRESDGCVAPDLGRQAGPNRRK